MAINVALKSPILYICLGVPCGSLKNIDAILMRSKTPSLAEMKCICAWKFVRSSYIGGDINGQNYLEDTILLKKMTSFSL
jgi:hypothetical protein